MNTCSRSVVVIMLSNTLRITADDILSELYLDGMYSVTSLPKASLWKEVINVYFNFTLHGSICWAFAFIVRGENVVSRRF